MTTCPSKPEWKKARIYSNVCCSLLIINYFISRDVDTFAHLVLLQPGRAWDSKSYAEAVLSVCLSPPLQHISETDI